MQIQNKAKKKISMQQRINFASHCWDKWNAFINCLTFKKRAEKNHDYSLSSPQEKISTMLENRDNRTFSLIDSSLLKFLQNIPLPFLALFFRSLPQLPRWPMASSKLTLFRELQSKTIIPRCHRKKQHLKNTKNKPKIPRLWHSHASNHHDHDIEKPRK